MRLKSVPPAASILAVIALTVAVQAGAKEPALFALDRGDPRLSAQGKTVDERIADFMAANHLPGMTMAIVQAPYIPRSAGYGRASQIYDELASTKTMWSIGPITQGFTDVAILQLFEQGKLDLDAPIGSYLKGLPAAWKPVTVYQLLQHASGIADYRRTSQFSQTTKYRARDLLDLVAAQPLAFEPGTAVGLSATNFALLALIVEKASGMSYHAFVWKYQIDPLGLHSTMFAEDLPTRSLIDRPAPDSKRNQHARFTREIPFVDPVEAATGYRAGTDAPVESMATQNLLGFGDLWSSAEDISKWDIALAGDILVRKPADRDLIYGATTLANGSVVPAMGGWEFTHHPGFMEIKGSSPGFSAYLSRFTSKDELVCVTLLANREGVDLTGLARDVAEAYMAGLGSGLNSDEIVNQESKFGVDETVDRLVRALEAGHVPVFATVDHADNARNANLALPPSKVIVFGNPAVGTALMRANAAIALELPLRMAVWQDARGRVWVSSHDIHAMSRQYGVDDSGTIDVMTEGLTSLIERAVNVYAY